MCDIWRLREKQELSLATVESQIESLRELNVKWMVFSGGEPQLHSDLAAIARPIRNCGIRLTLLTAGLLLASRAREAVDLFDDIIVSLDGPAEIHNAIRGIPNAFERLRKGIESVRALSSEIPISGRCTVQKLNRQHLRCTVRASQGLGLDSISFLATDVTSEAFNRPGGWNASRQQTVALTSSEVAELNQELEALIRECQDELRNGFIAESTEKLGKIVFHYRALLGETEFVAPRCNAPWVSAVVEANGNVKPCFFHPAFGNLSEASLTAVLNKPSAIAFRQRLNVAENPVCKRCVCSLYRSTS